MARVSIPVHLPWQWLKGDPLRSLLILGVVLRLASYAWGRQYWMDEGSFLGSLKTRGLFDFSQPLAYNQLVPPAFLLVERIVVAVAGTSVWVTRLLPLGCGLASLWFFRDLTHRFLSPRASFVALLLFACSDDLIYYAEELKPYSSDVFVGLLILRLSLSSREARFAPWALVAVLALAPWCSFPSAFFVAGCGVTIGLECLARGSKREALRVGLLAAIWVVSSWGAYRVSRQLQGPAHGMSVFWNFAFVDFRPGRAESWRKVAEVLLEMFVNPLNVVAWGLPRSLAILPVATLALGLVRMARRDWTLAAMLAMPPLFGLIATSLSLYPFHGRLILPFAPVCFLLIAEGSVFGSRGTWRGSLSSGLIVLLLVYPCVSALQGVWQCAWRSHNSHGDLHQNRFTP